MYCFNMRGKVLLAELPTYTHWPLYLDFHAQPSRDNGVSTNSVFTLNRLRLRSSKVPGATFDILTWNHDQRGYCYATATVRSRQDCSYNGQSLAQGIVVASVFKIQRSCLVVRQHLFFNAL